jgi:GTPase KRas
MLTDTAGQEEYRGLWTASNLKSDAFLLVYDITNAQSLDALDHFHSLIEIEEVERMDRGAVAPVKIVAGNKCDLQAQRVVRSAQGLEWARGRKCGFMETSAREMVNIEETFAREYHLRRAHWKARLSSHRFLTAFALPVIVRRVVEARRRVGGPATFASAQRTLPLEPLNEKPLTTIDPASLNGRSGPSQRFWSRLKCW